MYLVYIFPKGNRTARAIHDPRVERQPNDVVAEMKRTQRAVGEDMGTTDEAGEVGTFLFTGRGAKDMATKAAERLAILNPGDDIYVAAIQSVVTTTVPTVIHKTVSEKGVLPA